MLSCSLAISKTFKFSLSSVFSPDKNFTAFSKLSASNSSSSSSSSMLRSDGSSTNLNFDSATGSGISGFSSSATASFSSAVCSPRSASTSRSSSSSCRPLFVKSSKRSMSSCDQFFASVSPPFFFLISSISSMSCSFVKSDKVLTP